MLESHGVFTKFSENIISSSNSYINQYLKYGYSDLVDIQSRNYFYNQTPTLNNGELNEIFVDEESNNSVYSPYILVSNKPSVYTNITLNLLDIAGSRYLPFNFNLEFPKIPQNKECKITISEIDYPQYKELHNFYNYTENLYENLQFQEPLTVEGYVTSFNWFQTNIIGITCPCYPFKISFSDEDSAKLYNFINKNYLVLYSAIYDGLFTPLNDYIYWAAYRIKIEFVF